jgi:hypothetical protein
MNGAKLNNRQYQGIKKALCNGMYPTKAESGDRVRNAVKLPKDKMDEIYKIIKLLFEKELLDTSSYHTDEHSLSFNIRNNQNSTNYKNIQFRIEKGTGLGIYMDDNNSSKHVMVDDVDMYNNLRDYVITKINEGKMSVYNELFDDILKMSGLNRDLNLEGLLK